MDTFFLKKFLINPRAGKNILRVRQPVKTAYLKVSNKVIWTYCFCFDISESVLNALQGAAALVFGLV